VPNTSGPERRTAPGSAAGVFDTVADAFSFILGRPWLIIVPLLTDLVVWLVLNVSIQPLTKNIARFIENSGATDSDLAADSIRTMGESARVSDGLGAFLPSVFSGLSLDSVLNILVTAFSPNMGFGIDRTIPEALWSGGLFGSWEPASAGMVALIGVACALAGTLLLAIFRVPLARAVRGEDLAAGIVPEIGLAWLHFIGFLALLAVAAVVALIPILIASTVFLILGFNLIFVVTMALFIFGGMASVYTLFMVDAMLLHRTGPIRAFRTSTHIGRLYFGQVARFALTSIFVMLGALQLWTRMADSLPGMTIALVANAFLGTAFSFAGMLFYADRFRQTRIRERAHRR